MENVVQPAQIGQEKEKQKQETLLLKPIAPANAVNAMQMYFAVLHRGQRLCPEVAALNIQNGRR